jgi:hypothetical protein
VNRRGAPAAQADDDGQSKNDGHDRWSELDLRQTRNAAGIEDLEQRHETGRHRQGQCRAGEAEDQRFGQPLADEIASPGAERGAHRRLARAEGGVRELQVGHVRTGNDQQQADRPEQQPECAANAGVGPPCAG